MSRETGCATGRNTATLTARRSAGAGMWAKIAVVLSCLALLACGGRAARQAGEPAYHSVAELGAVEVRQYGVRIVAETMVEGEEEAARSVGYRRLADYFTGVNRGGATIAMTAPWMQGADAPGHWRFRLFMPDDETMATLPQPSDPSVALLPVPAETLAVLRFSGAPSAEAVAAHTGELVAALEGSAWRPAGAPVAWFYELPWTLPPQRRNEVAIPVSPK